MDIVNKRRDMIKPYGKNPRKNDEAVKYVAESIKQFGFKVPIIIDCDGVIVAGHTRYKAAKKLKMETVPCIVADDLTDEQIKAFRLADNKVAEKAAAEKAALPKSTAPSLPKTAGTPGESRGSPPGSRPGSPQTRLGSVPGKPPWPRC